MRRVLRQRLFHTHVHVFAAFRGSRSRGASELEGSTLESGEIAAVAGCRHTQHPEPSFVVADLLRRYYAKNAMMTASELSSVLSNLEAVLVEGVEGNVVELGCHIGNTSIFIRRLLDQFENVDKMEPRSFHVYDSWEGLPQKDETKDGFCRWFYQGALAAPQASFARKFRRACLRAPIQHKGWFIDADYPEKIGFAFFDGDFYQSVLNSFEMVYPRLTPGARIVIDDYGSELLPGCKMACDDFLADKPEKVVQIPMYGHENSHIHKSSPATLSTGGLLIKI